MINPNHPLLPVEQDHQAGWQFLLHGLPEAVAVADLGSGELLAVNEGFSQLTGFPSARIIGRPVRQLNLFADSRDHTRLMLQLYQSGLVQNFEATFLTEDGKYLSALLSSRVSDMAGRSVVVTVAREMAALKLAQQALQESEERYRRIFENIQDIYFEASMGGILLEISPSISLCSGWKREELIGSFLNDVLFDSLQFQGLVGRLQSQQQVLDHEIIFLDDQGTQHFGSVNAGLMLSSEGKPLKIIGSMRDVSEAKRARDKIHQLAYFDALTGLPNRSLFQDRLSRAITLAARHEGCLALLYLDLDGFKQVNDTLGHAGGDALLKIVAQRLTGCVRFSDTVARLGGDEFVVLIPEEASVAGVTVVAEKILHALDKPFAIAEQEVFVGASIGVVFYPNDAMAAEGLLKNADMAMYAAKNAGRNNFQFFSEQINQQNLQRRESEIDLRRAMQEQELEVLFQPRFDLVRQTTACVEAVPFWVAEHGEVLWGTELQEWIDRAGLAREVALWLLTEACSRFVALDRSTSDQVRLAIVLPVSLLRQNDFLGCLDDILQTNGMLPTELVIEIDEDLWSRDAARSEALLQELKTRGIGLVIEGFGEGRFSLANLRDDLIDGLKISPHLTAEVMTSPRHAALVKTIISMAKIMGLTITAQGVDDQALFGFLQYHKCDRIQGEYYSPPLPPDELADLLQSGGRPQN